MHCVQSTDTVNVPTVLVVEDDPDTREMERFALQCTGFHVEVASNGRAALEALSELRPCVILLDLMMPVMNGLDFLKSRQLEPALAKIPVICVSAAGPGLLSAALKLGAQECLVKPADLDVICERVRVLCGGR